MTDRFEELLRELSQELGVALHPDKRGACKLKINDILEIQLECDAHQENLLVASFLCDIPPGKFRENILKDALKANSAFPLTSTLAYSERNNKLTLFSYLRLVSLTGQKLAEFLALFIDKASQWRTAVETGNTAQLVSAKDKPPSGMFGLTHG